MGRICPIWKVSDPKSIGHRSSCVSSSKTHGRRIFAVMADAYQGLLVLVLAVDDGHGRALPIRVGGGLALDGDVVPGQGSLWMGFDDGFFGREPRRIQISHVISENEWRMTGLPARHE